MKKKDFYFDLPQELIAQYPTPSRTDARLLVYSRQNNTYLHESFRALPDFLEKDDLLVMNNSKVIRGRFYGHKSTGGRVEFLIERILDDTHFTTHMKASKALKRGECINLANGYHIKIIDKMGTLYCCEAETSIETILEQIGHVPLPPYIKRDDQVFDEGRYQTVFARHKGSIAAPTAGLHFDQTLLETLKAKGVRIAFTTLHIGSGTFQPLRCDSITEHQMHSEQFIITDELINAIHETQARGKRIIAVGTTALRSLESAVENNMIKPGTRETNIFIYPGYQFKLCHGLITNFHLPESTLLMLVSAFIGHKETMVLYQEAIKHKYRFFSYGDASLLI